MNINNNPPPPPGHPGAQGMQPPPIPPRPGGQSAIAANGYSYGSGNYGMGYGGSYGGMSYSNYSSPYSYGGGYGSYGASSFGYGGPVYAQQSDFARIAEEQSRSALSSVETVVQAFTSISMMLESTLSAFYSSFRAIIGVADQFQRLRGQLYNILTSLAILQWLRYLANRLLVLLNLREPGLGLDGEAAWAASEARLLPGGAPRRTNRLSLMFFALAIGGPYLIWKFIQKIAQSVEDSRKWSKGESEHYEAKTLYDFVSSQPSELSFKANEILRIAPKEEQPQVRGWLLAADMNGEHIGLIPNNYIEMIGRRNYGDQRETRRTMERNFASALKPSASTGDLTD